MSLIPIIAGASRRRGGAFDPLSLSPTLWLDAADSTTIFNATSGGSLPAADAEILRWEDKSSSANHATENAAGGNPLRKTSVQNGLDGVLFDGTNDRLGGAARIYTNGNFCVFGVVKGPGQDNKIVICQRSDSGASGRTHFICSDFASPFQKGRIFFNNGSNRNVISTSNAFDDSAHLIHAAGNNADYTIAIDGGSIEATQSVGSLTVQDIAYTLGALPNGSASFNGYIFEILCYPVLTSAEVTAVSNYLLGKWDI